MKVRIGIDVGGTFTDVVVIDHETRELVGQLKVPTSHDSDAGVAGGIINALEQIMKRFNLSPDDVSFIAHSTTQATNALLEGDLASVGVIGLGKGAEGLLSRFSTRIPPISLTRDKSLIIKHSFLSSKAPVAVDEIDRALTSFLKSGVTAVAVSEAFGVDDGVNEDLVSERARTMGMQATSGHEVSGLYGLRARTRTAVINAAILPRMIETAQLTEQCVRNAGIRSPLMIMRSDGGVMSIDEVRRRPIQTILSGPAAGIAGALMHERVSDGVFIEVGGTSADISVIRDGSPIMRPARIGGHRMYVDTLDVRTIGIAGGSMIRVDTAKGALTDAGPRSAHIAGCRYTCFATTSEIEASQPELMSPAAGDPGDHFVLRGADGTLYAITTSCAANLLGYVPDGNFARGNKEAAALAFGKLARFLKLSTGVEEALASKVLEISAAKVKLTVEDLIREYQLDRSQLRLIGGGGGAASLVPVTANLMELDYSLARNAEVISPIGVAMAMVRDTVERNIVDPGPEDILRIRQEAAEAASSAGAVPETIEVSVEVDVRRNLVRATAVGATELRKRDDGSVIITEVDFLAIAAKSMKVEANQVSLVAETGRWRVYQGIIRVDSWIPFLKSETRLLRILERSGSIRLQRRGGIAKQVSVSEVETRLAAEVEAMTNYGDAGRSLPDIFILSPTRIINFSGLADFSQIRALLEVEIKGISAETALIMIVSPRQG